MSFVIVAPEALMSVASEVAGIGSALNAANAAAAAPTTGVLAAAADEVSAAMAALFGAHAQEYQRLSAQAAGFHAQFVQALNAGVNSYASAEAANASPLQAVEQQVLGLINGPAQTLLGRPLIGNGADGAPGTGQPGGPGGLLWGNGGNGGAGGGGVGGARALYTFCAAGEKKGEVISGCLRVSNNICDGRTPTITSHD
ncbi:PE family protein, partial [Mycobacterium tuberculosis]|uniref:PE family protein n=1 Tax=Mycobacterium tuberculosis TaxID=1773 RepID=UPI001F488B52